MTSKRKDRICALLKGIETGDAAATAVVNPDKYIQHNPQTREGGEGLAALFKRLAKSSPRVNIVRVFSDGDYVFAHTEYEFSSSRIGFEVFRFEGDLTVEHWDNIQSRKGPNPSGRTMVDGPTEATDLDRTESNREIVRSFVDEVLINRLLDKLEQYIDGDNYTEHNPRISDGLSALRTELSQPASNHDAMIRYDRNHRLLAEGNFVLSVSEGALNGIHTSFYDLFRVAHGKLVEHWDTTEAIPPRSEWKNDNGKF
ncbi:MAG: nuclear transport factor 2 family protein [Acidobacteriota bacterium]|nr:nuclear transport factor 2 family protein [Acidobacteriota bacterium]